MCFFGNLFETNVSPTNCCPTPRDCWSRCGFRWSQLDRACCQPAPQGEWLRDLSEYAALIRRSVGELQSLFEEVVVPETFFFRYPESFASLGRIVGEKFLSGTQKVRVLSVPCSTGEEPYSIAITLLEAGLSLEKFHINAIDINAFSLATAKAGLFGSNSFRGSTIDFRNRYFQQCDSGFRISNDLRRSVKFEQANILGERFESGGDPYDFIFCRNLLIYFYPEAQDLVLKKLRQLLTADGLLFVGPAETSLLTQHRLSSVKLPMAFAFRKSVPGPSAQFQNRNQRKFGRAPNPISSKLRVNRVRCCPKSGRWKHLLK